MKRLLLITLFSLALGCLLAGCDDASNPDALSQSTPQLSVTPRPTPDPSTIPSYLDVQATLEAGETEAQALVGTRLENWRGWVVRKQGGSVFVHIADPFAEEILPSVTWHDLHGSKPSPAGEAVRAKLKERDRNIALTLTDLSSQQLSRLVYGQEIRFSGTVEKVSDISRYGNRKHLTLTGLNIQLVEDVFTPFVEEPTKVAIRLDFYPGYGVGTQYSLSIDQDGRITYEGRDHVKVCGAQTEQIDREAVMELVALFTKADFFALRDFTDTHDNDDPTEVIALTLNDRTHEVAHYWGDNTSPTRLQILSHRIDELADSDRWVGGPAYYPSCNPTPTSVP